MKPTPEQVEKWAREAKLPAPHLTDIPDLVRLCKLAYAAGQAEEREACAKAAEDADDSPIYGDGEPTFKHGVNAAAKAIRARSKA